VITPDIAYFGNGTMTAVRRGLNRDLCAVLAGTDGRFADNCAVVVDGVPVEAFSGQSDKVRAAGWKHTDLRAWTLFHRDGRTVSLGLRASMDPRRHHFDGLFTADTDPGALALILDRYHQCTGFPWRGTYAMTALAALRLTWGNERYQPLWHHPKETAGNMAGPLVWSRPLNEWERTWGWVHRFDAVSAYLGSAINAEVSWGPLNPTGAIDFDPGLPGYWTLELPAELLEVNADPTRPPLLSKVRNGRATVTTPYARFLIQDLGYPCRVADSLTGRAEHHEDGGRRIHPAASRVLRKWGEGLRDVLSRAELWPAVGLREVLTTAVKRTYKDATGAMQREVDGRGMTVQRADWSHTLIDLWRATMYRRMIRVHASEGVWPVAVRTDSLDYADCTAEHPRNLATAVGVRPGLGGWRHEEVFTTAAWMAQHRPRRERLVSV
jgi:hypothetical protein